MTAVNDEGGKINLARDQDGQEDTIPRTMQKYQARSEPWMLVVDDNCESSPDNKQRTNTDLLDGEGSAREHAALQPRFYGCQMIVARSFARIHETNLKVNPHLSIDVQCHHN